MAIKASRLWTSAIDAIQATVGAITDTWLGLRQVTFEAVPFAGRP